MSDTHKVILIVSALVIVAVLAALKVIGGDVTGAAILSVIAFFAVPLVWTLFYGRTFCAAVCPL